MGLKNAFQKAAIAAFNAAGDIKTSITYRSKTNSNPSFNPSTGVITDPYTDYTDIKFIFLKYESREIDGKSILKNDMKGIIPVLNLTPTPKRDDQIILNSVLWNVIAYEKDPADALWEIQFRKP